MKMKTLKITEATHTSLTKVKGAVTQATGKEATYDDAIRMLIIEYNAHQA